MAQELIYKVGEPRGKLAYEATIIGIIYGIYLPETILSVVINELAYFLGIPHSIILWIFHGCPYFLLVRSALLPLKSQLLLVKSQFVMFRSQFFMVKSQLLMVRSC